MKMVTLAAFHQWGAVCPVKPSERKKESHNLGIKSLYLALLNNEMD